MTEIKCRLCARLTKKAKTEQLFSRRNRERLHQIETLTGLKLTKMPHLPGSVCVKCKDALEQAHQFRENCLRAQEYFRKEPRLGVRNKTTISGDPHAQEEEKQSELSKVLDGEEAHETAVENCANDCTQEVKNKLSPANSLKLNNRNTLKASKTRKSTSSLSSKKYFICDQCGNRFSCLNRFNTHLQRHSGDKRFHCELCSSKFFTYSELNRHMRRHTGEKPFACQYCNRRFTDYSTRIKHERTHTNERPYVCTLCDKAFTRSYILKNHMVIHTGERAFKCDLCNKSFQRQTNLLTHYRSLSHKENEMREQRQELETLRDLDAAAEIKPEQLKWNCPLTQ